MKTLVCLHGFLGSSADFEFYEKNLSAKYNVIALDIPTNLENYSLANIAKNILEQLQAKKISQATFWGYSMGGRILLELSKLSPEIFEGLILESTSPGLSDTEKPGRLEADKRWADLLATSFRAKQPMLFLAKWYEQTLFKNFVNHRSFAKKILEREKNLTEAHAKMILEGSPAANNAHFDLLSQIQVPVLVLLGELDLKYGNLWANLIAKPPHFGLKTISKAGHVVHLENSPETLMAVQKFLSNQERALL